MRTSRTALPADMCHEAAVEPATLSMTVASTSEYFEHFEEIEQQVRQIAVGIETVLAARVAGQPLFTRYYDHRAAFAEMPDVS